MHKLDNRQLISQLDTSGMLRLINELPDQCQKAYDIGRKSNVLKPEGHIENIVFAGMGGSAIGADIVRIYLKEELNIPIIVSRNYTLPAFAGKGTLLFCSSYSGNTEETLSSFKEGLKRGVSIITLGSGGALKELSEKNKLAHIEVPKGFPPRAAIGYMCISILGIMERLEFIRDRKHEVEAVYSALSELRNSEVGMEVPLDKNISKQLACKLYDRYTIVYGTSDSTEAIALRWRGQLAENSKSLSSSHVFPEMNHNEIVGWEFPPDLLKDIKVIILRDESDHARTKRRIDITRSIIEKRGAEIFEFERKGKTLLARLFSLIYIGDFVSFYLAILNGIDPTPVARVDYLKSELARS